MNQKKIRQHLFIFQIFSQIKCSWVCLQIFIINKSSMHISGSQCDAIPRAESFLVLMIFAAYSCPDDFFIHLRTTEKAPLRTKKINKQKLVPFHMLSLARTESVTLKMANHSCGSGLCMKLLIKIFFINYCQD